MYAPRNMCFKNGFSSAIYIFIFLQELCWGQQRSSRTSSGNRNEEFSCPEEFGYYPHPGDCTLYYVCVFGGALLESCTGGLMYSHELQTCDWPRNVGCGEANGIDSPSAPGIVNTNRVTDTRGPPLQRGRELPQQQSHQQQDHQQPHQQVAKQLYEEEDLGPAEEEETDRQQRVYRGQPSTLSQVARDRDGLPRHTNALQSSPVSGKDKLSVVSYGSNQQYRTDLIPRVSTENFEHDNKLDAYKTKRRRKRQLYSSRPVNARWPHLLPPGSKIIAHVNPMQGLALQQASGDNMYSPSHYYLFPATPPPAPPPPGPGVPQSIQSQNYRNGATPQIIDLKSYFQLPNPPNINQPHPLHPPHNLIAHQGAAPPTAGPYNIPNVTPNPIPINTPTLSYATPVPWSAATSQATDRTTLLSMRPNSQIKIYTPMTDQTTPSSSIKMPPKPPGALLANHNLDETVSPQESKGHDYLRNGNHRESPDGQNHHRPNHNKKNQAHGSHHHNHRDDDNVGYPRHRYNESIRHHNEASGTHRQAESFETDPNAGTSDDEGGGGREGDEEDEGGGDDGGGGGGGGSGGEGGGEEEATGSQDAERSNEGGEEAPQIDPPVRNRYKNIPLRDLRNKLRDLDGHFEDPRFKIYMSKLKLKMNEKFPHATRSDESGGSVEFESEKHLGGFSDEFGDSIGDLEDHDDDEGIEPQLIFTTPDTRNIGSFTPTPRPRPTKKPKGAITPLGVSHSYRPANYSYRRNYGHKKNTKPYGESTESYDDLYDTQLHAALPPSSAFDRDECCDEYGNPKQGVGLGAYHSDHGPKNVALSGDNFSEYPRHKGYDSPTPYYSTPAGPPSGKPKVKQKPGPPPPLEGGQKDYDEEYYEDNAQYDNSYDQRRPASDDEGDNEEYYGEGYDDEEYAEDYKHERPGHLNGTHVKAPRPPKMMKHIDHRVKSPAIKYGSSKNNGSNDDEYYDDEYYDDEDYYDDTTTNKVTQPSVRQKFRGSNATDITMDPELSSSVDAYSVLKSSSPSYRRPKTFAPTNFNKSDIMQNERTTPLSETPNPPTPPTPHPAHATTPRYLIKPKFRKKTTPHQSDVDDEAKLTTPNGVPAQNYPVKFSRFKNKLSLSSTPMPKISESGNGSQSHNFTISSKYRKPHRQKLKTYSARNRTVASPTQNRTQDAMLEGAQSNRTPETQTEPPQDSQKFGGKTRVSPKNHRMPTVDGARPLNVKHTNPKDPNSSFQSHPSPSSNRGQNKGENSQDELKIPANHKTQPTGRLVTNNRGTASQRQNPKQLQKQTSTPSAGQATDRVSVAPPNYVSQQAPVQVGIGSSASVANRGIYNGTQYNPSQQQFDSYYNLYNDEAELYGDDDYGQYVSNRGKHPPQIEIVQRLPEKNAVAYTPVQSYKQQENAYTPSYKAQGNVGYTPSYKQQQSDIYNVDDYNQQYSLQGADDDLSYQQPGIIANKPSIRLVAARNESKVNETKQQQHPVHPIPSKPHELVAPLPSQRITLSAAFALENTPNYKSAQPAGFAPNRGGRPTTNFFIVKDDASEPAKKPDEITDEFALKKDVKNIEITRMRASGKNVPQVPSFPPRDTSKPSYVASTLIPPSLPPRRQFNGSSSFSFEDNSNFRIIVDSSPKANPTLATPIGFRFLNNTTKFVPSTTSIPKESPRGTFKPRPFAHPDWIDSVDITSTSARPVTSPEPSNHRFERVNFEKEVAELSRNNPVYHSITKVPVQFTTEASTSRIAIKIPQRIASKVDQSTKKVDVTNAVSRFLSDLSFTTKKPERPRSKLEENDVQRFSTPLTPVSRFWSSPKVEISTVGKAVYPPKYDVKPTEATNFQGRSFFASKENPQNLNANNKPSYNVDKKPSKFDENVEDEEYYDDEYYEDDEVEEEKPKAAAPPIPLSTQAPRPPSTSQSPPQPAPVTYKPSIKLPISSLVKEYSFPSKSATRTQTLSRDNEVNNAKESLQNPCSEQNSECNEKPLVSTRVRPAPVSPVTEESQASLDYPRGRPRGSATYTTASSESDRGTPLSSGGRPTLKPSQSIVSKASEFVDIYKFPPRRPESVYPTPQVDKTAAKCRKDVCLLPDCYCGGKDVPGDLSSEETPQLVLLTFDDSVNDLNKGLYSDLFEKGRTNPNGCPISATFYVSHEWTDYSQVQNLYAGGHEIASHSVSHSFGEQFSQKKWTREIAGQREILAAYGGVKQEDIRGMRAPFLAVGGNKMFKMLYDSNFTYDSSMPVYENRPPSWPYTFDYKIFHDCMIPPCPTRSYPGVWEVPMVMWQDLNGGRCSMGDACSNPPTSDGVYKMLVKNFERHFTTNRAPFGLFYHAAWFTQPHHKEAFIAFLDTIVNMPEVWVVTNWQALQWVRDPTPISRLRNFTPFGCDYPDRPRKCNNPKVCNLWHKSGVRYMRTCQPCPDIYPWTGKTGIKTSKVDNEIIQE